MNNASSTAAFSALLDLPADTLITLDRLDLRGWGQTLVFGGTAGDAAFELRCDARWRSYAYDDAVVTTLVSFAAGRDQHRSPLQMLTEHFGLTLFYGSLTLKRLS